MKFNIICGTNNFLIEEEISKIEKDSEFEVAKLDGSNLNRNDILLISSSSSMFSEKKIGIIQGFLQRIIAEEKSGDWDNILPELEQVDSPNEIVFVEQFDEESDQKRFQKNNLIRDLNCPIDVLNTPKGKGSWAKIKEWISEREEYFGLKLSDSQKNFLLDESNRDFDLIDNELEKLSLFSGGGQLNNQDFNELVSLSKIHINFDLLDNFFGGNKKEVSKILVGLFKDGVSVNELIGLLNSELHKILEIQSLFNEGINSQSQISDKTGIKSEFYINKLMKSARQVDHKRLLRIQHDLLNFDIKSKTESFNQILEFELLLSLT